MARLTILEFPDPRLRTKAVPVEAANVTTAEFQRLLDDMFETMYAAPGIGLAATQVDYHKRLVVMDVSEDKSKPLVLINPEIIERSGELEIEEGCLSVPGVFDTPTVRSENVRVRALGRDGKPFELEAEGLLAVAIQHENEHLDGELMIDHLGPVRRRLVQRQLAKHRSR